MGKVGSFIVVGIEVGLHDEMICWDGFILLSEVIN